MREDMFKVIVERPRSGWRTRRHKRRTFAGEDALPMKIGMKKHIHATRIHSKWLNENLNPLKRYLRSQLGRPWDDVYSDISATLSPDHTVKQHVREHLDDFVARRIFVRPDGVWLNGSDRRFWGNRAEPWRQPFYVDPYDGILKDSSLYWAKVGFDPKAWRPREVADPNIRLLDKARELRCIDGIWYELIFVHERERPKDEWAFDLLTRARVRANTRRAIAKRQLSRDELLAHGISNSNH
jgi:hypothetical protein